MIELTRAAPSEERVMIRCFSNTQPSMTLIYHSPPIKPGSSVRDVLGRVDQHMTEGVTERDDAANIAASRIVVNLASYLQSRDEKENPIWTPRAKPHGRGRTTTWDIGHAVKLPQNVHAAARAFTAEPGSETWKLFYRHVIKGHMQGYWYGPKKDPAKREKRTKWIAPYWQGPAESPVRGARIYDVDEKKR